LTAATRAVLDVLLATGPGEYIWGLRICERADLGPGTVYPILERLSEAGWIEGRWEAGHPSGRPRRRYYQVTGGGRAAIAEAFAARTARRRRWNRLAPTAGGTG
jgi:DNA-binding PadR family transcriptional regulator